MSNSRHKFKDHKHLFNICPHKTCAMSRKWLFILERDGSYETERRIQRRPLWRAYDSRWPYDSGTKAGDLDAAFDLSDGSPDPLERIIMDEGRAEYLSRLTPSQEDIAKLLEQGHKPRDIAKLYGREDSGSIRWQKHAIRQRFEDYKKEGDGHP